MRLSKGYSRLLILLGVLSQPGYSLDFTPSMLLSFIQYDESPLQIQLSQTSITGRLTLTQAIISGNPSANLSPNQKGRDSESLLSAEGSISGTLLTMSHSPRTIDSARFLGFDGHLVSPKVIHATALSLQFTFGWYLWQMYVPQNAYGIENLAGPIAQARIAIKNIGIRDIGIALKFSPFLSSTGAFTADNREWTLQVAYDLFSHPAPSRNVNLILEATQSRFRKPSLDNSMSMFAWFVGVQSLL